MARKFDPATFECPYCGCCMELPVDDAIYYDDVEDESTTTCIDCGKEFRLVCEEVEVEMEAYPVEGGDG